MCVSQGQTQLESCAVMSLSLLKLQMFKFQVCPCPCDMGKTKPTPGLDFDWGFTKLVFNLNKDISSVGMKPSAGDPGSIAKFNKRMETLCFARSPSQPNTIGDVSSAPVPNFPTTSSSLVSHWNPHLHTPPQTPYNSPSMLSHCIFVPPPEQENLLSKEDFLKIWAEHREQFRKDWAEIISKINILKV